jgi:2-ketocyclohexanecarboxyl-CoA hydrolase
MAEEQVGAVGEEKDEVLYEVDNGLAWITINRPHRYNAYRGRTIDLLIEAFLRAWSDNSVGVVALTGAGDKAFSAGGDQKQRHETGDYGPTQYGQFRNTELGRIIRSIPKPVVAAVNGYAIGGGHVLHMLCDLTIASDNAIFGQNGPRVGSFDAGFGTGYMARIIGEKRAREVWFLCRRYSAQQALEWGLCNAVVPQAELKKEVRQWADEMLAMAPTTLRFLKYSFNVDTEQFAGVEWLATSALATIADSPEVAEGVTAFNEKRPPDFSEFRDRAYRGA